MSRKKFVFATTIIVLIILGSNCTNNNNLDQSKEIKVYNINNGFKEQRDVLLSKIADSIFYIKLETKSESYIVRIEKIFFVNGKIIVFDRISDRVLVFKDNGEFLCQIGKQGSGPEEYTHIAYVSVDVVNNYCFLLIGAMMKIMKFDLEGNFVSSFKLNNIIVNDIEYFRSGINVLFIADKYSSTSEFYNIICLDSIGNIAKRSIKVMNRGGILKNESVGRFNLYSYNNYVYAWNEFRNDTIYKISRSLSFTPCYQIAYNLNKMPHEIRVDKRFRNENINMAKVNNVFETKDYFFILGSKDRHEKSIILDKMNNKSFHLRRQEIWETHIQDYDGFTNDLDGGLPFWPIGYYSEKGQEFLYYNIDVINIKQYKKQIDKQSNNYDINSNKGQLTKLIFESKIDDNPIITVVRMKD